MRTNLKREVGGVNCVVAFYCRGHSWNPGMGKDKQTLQDIALISLVHIVMNHCTILPSVIVFQKENSRRLKVCPNSVSKGRGQN